MHGSLSLVFTIPQGAHMNESTTNHSTLSRRTVAKGVAWSVPAVAVTIAAPAFAGSSLCDPSLSAGGGMNYDWFTSTKSTYDSTQTQLLRTAHSMDVVGLPLDARITSLSIEIYMPNRVDNSSNPQPNWYDFGAYDPGNRYASTNQRGECTTSYASITGCDFSSLYRHDVQQPLNVKTGYTLSQDQAGTPEWWRPDVSDARVFLESNWTPYTFISDELGADNKTRAGTKTRKAWKLVYEGDASAIPTTESDPQYSEAFALGGSGCKTFTGGVTPAFEVVYSGVKTPTVRVDSANKLESYTPPLMEAIWTVTYETQQGTPGVWTSHTLSEKGTLG